MSYGTPPPPPGGQPPYGQPPYGEQPPYGSQPPGGQYGAPGGYAAQPKNSVLAIVSLVTGILGILCCGSLVLSIAAIITGVLGRKEIAASGGLKTGDGMAKAGFICGIVGVVLGVIYLILLLAGAIHFNFSSSSN